MTPKQTRARLRELETMRANAAAMHKFHSDGLTGARYWLHVIDQETVELQLKLPKYRARKPKA